MTATLPSLCEHGSLRESCIDCWRSAPEDPAGDEPHDGAGDELRRVVLVPASSIPPRPTRWLVADRVPLGDVTLVAGREGLGKSLLTAAWIAAATLGTLDGDLRGPVTVLVVVNEDDPARTVVPRLIAAGADLDRVLFVRVTDPLGPSSVMLPRDVARVVDATRDSGARLIVLDPLVSVLDGRLDSHRDHSIRQALDPLNRLAQSADAAVVGLVHVGKSQAGDLNDRVLGSRAFTATARAVVSVLADPDDEDNRRRLVVQAKSNLGRLDLPALVFTVDGVTLPTAEGDASVGVLRWHEPLDVSVDELLRTPADPDERDERSDAERWLVDYLTDKGGESTSADVKRAAATDGHAWRTVQRVRRRSGVAVERRGFGTGSVWILDPSAPQSRHPRQGVDAGANGANGATDSAAVAP